MSGVGSYTGALAGQLDGRGLRVAIVAAQFNDHIVGLMLERCIATLVEHGVAADDIRTVRVPGAFELPQAAARIAGLGGGVDGSDGACLADAVIALGCVIRGDTPHFDFVAGEAARGLGQVGAAGRLPVIFGVLTTENEAQALERAEVPPRGQDKGREAALAALSMARLFETLDVDAVDRTRST